MEGPVELSGSLVLLDCILMGWGSIASEETEVYNNVHLSPSVLYL